MKLPSRGPPVLCLGVFLGSQQLARLQSDWEFVCNDALQAHAHPRYPAQ